MTADWQYVRETANHYTNAPVLLLVSTSRKCILLAVPIAQVTDVTSDAIRCYELDSTSAGAAGIATVAAGSTVGFQSNIAMYHPGVSTTILIEKHPGC